MVDTTDPQQGLEETSKTKLLEALAGLPVMVVNPHAPSRREYEHTGAPLRDATSIFLNEGNLEVSEEAKLIQVFLRKIFEIYKIGQEAQSGDTYPISFIRDYLNFVLLARERYTAVTEETSYHDCLRSLATEAAKHLDLRRSIPSIENTEEIQRVLEEINSILPLPQIEELRASFSQRIKQVLLHFVDTAYNLVRGPKVETIREAGERHGVDIPSEREYWEQKIRTVISELFTLVTNLEVASFRPDFSDHFSPLDDKVRSIAGLLPNAKDLNITFQIGDTTKHAEDFLIDIYKRVRAAVISNTRFRFEQEITLTDGILQSETGQGLERGLFGLERIINEQDISLGSYVLLERKREIDELKRILLTKIDGWLEQLAQALTQNKSQGGVISYKISQLSKLRTNILPTE